MLGYKLKCIMHHSILHREGLIIPVVPALYYVV